MNRFLKWLFNKIETTFIGKWVVIIGELSLYTFCAFYLIKDHRLLVATIKMIVIATVLMVVFVLLDLALLFLRIKKKGSIAKRTRRRQSRAEREMNLGLGLQRATLSG